MSDWVHRTVRDVVSHTASGPSPTCEERNASGTEWGLLKTTAVTWGGWNERAHKVPPVEYWGQEQLEVQSDDVVITKAGPRNRVGVVVHVPRTRPRLMVSGKMVLLRPDKSQIVPRLLADVLASRPSQKYLDDRTTGMAEAQTNFANSALLRTPLLLPPLHEQLQIAEILDTIDEAIQAAERAVAKLSVIRVGTTVAALEEVFADSRASTVDEEFELASGITLNAERAPRRNRAGYLRVANVRRGHVDLSVISELEATPGERVVKGLRPGDLLVVEGHANPNEIGRCAAVPDEAAGLLFQNHLFRLRPRRLRHEVAELILNSSEAVAYWRRVCSSSSGLNTINSTMLRSMPIPVPDLRTQDRLAALNADLNDRERAEETALRKLRQTRSALAADLLSGRVRTVVA